MAVMKIPQKQSMWPLWTKPNANQEDKAISLSLEFKEVEVDLCSFGPPRSFMWDKIDKATCETKLMIKSNAKMWNLCYFLCIIIAYNISVYSYSRCRHQNQTNLSVLLPFFPPSISLIIQCLQYYLFHLTTTYTL